MGVDFESDADRQAFFEDFDEATIGGVTVEGIFDNAHAAPHDVDSAGPSFTCRALDVQDVVFGTRMTINGDIYEVRGIQPDGLGLVTFPLEKQ